MSGLVAVGVLCALFAGVFRYVDQHFYDADAFLENNAELAANADVREFLFQGFRSEIIAVAEGDDEEEEDTTTIAERLAQENDENFNDPVTLEQIERDQAIEEILLDVFDSDLYAQTFTGALQSSQRELQRSAELESAALLRDKGEIVFNMQALYRPIWEMLGADPRTAEITTDVPPNDAGLFKVADRDTTITPLWSLIQRGPDWRGLMTLGAVLSFIGAVVIADRRPSTAIQFGSGMVGMGVVVIVLVFLIRFIVPLLAGGSSTSQVVAVYASNTSPLVSTMIRLAIFGAIIALLGTVARFIWPDNWVYSSVSDERGVRSIRRRRGEPEPAHQQTQQQPAAAAVPVGYPGYPQQPYGGYPQQWGQPYPGQYPPGYAAPYPVGPYGQPAQPLPQQQQPQHYTTPGQPTVPVMPVKIDGDPAPLVPPAAPPFDASPGELPADAAQVVPRVVATTDTTLDASTSTSTSTSTASAASAAASPSKRATPAANATIAETAKPAAQAPAATPKPAATTPDVKQPEVNKPEVTSPASAKATVADTPKDLVADIVVPKAEDADEWASKKDW